MLEMTMTDEHKSKDIAVDLQAIPQKSSRTAFSLLSLNSTKPRTGDDIARAKAEGRVAEMPLHQAGA
jgi:hypothetical protein